MTSIPADTTEASGTRGPVRCAPLWRRRGRHTGLCAALLVVVWAFPDVWCVGHLLAHALESEEHGAPLAIPAGDRIAGLYQSHDHGHNHPEISPVVPAGGTKEISVPAVLATAAESHAPTSTLRWQRDSDLGNPARHAVASSGPRAPPIA